ncbi:MAG: glycosyltransferase family 4 protein [Planctomycetales bacterium]|nr:glycosyltransferase family 4 protein [Planctomycetales bacterium]
MKIAFLSAGKFVPSSRFRLPFYRLLAERGHQCSILASFPEKYDYFPWLGWRPSQFLKRCVRRWHLQRIRFGHYDVVVLDRGLFHTADYRLEKELRRVAKRLVLEIDDAVFLPFPDKTAALADMADHVIAGNQLLAEWLRPHNLNLSIIPTCVDADVYTQRPDQTGNPPVVGWIGSAGNVIMLKVCAPALRRLASETRFILRVISGVGHQLAEIDLSGVDVQWIDYHRCSEIQELHNMDIGIMPLPEGDPWMPYKCNAKMIQYLTVGLPTVASALGFNFELVRPGENGFLATDQDQWYEHLSQLLASPSLRQQIGISARQSMLSSFTAQSRVQQFEAILQEVADAT